MTQHVTTAVLLAAGQASRMGELGLVLPKALAPVVNEPLLIRHLRALARHGVTKAHIVVGHLRDQLTEAVAAHPVPGLTVQFHLQAERLGLAHAVSMVEDAVKEPFLLLLADIAFDSNDFGRMLDLKDEAGCLLAVKEELDTDAIRRNFSVQKTADGWVRKVIEKPQDPPNRLKGTGQYTFDPRVFDAIRATPRSALRNEYEITDTIQILIDRGVRTRALDVIRWDCNLTYPADLLACNLHYLDQARKSGQAGLGTPPVLSDLPEGSIVENSVIGRGVHLARAMRITNSVLLDGAHIDGPETLDRVLVEGDRIYPDKAGT